MRKSSSIDPAGKKAMTGAMDHGHRPDHSLERLIFFSDAVFAIAITLLVVEIHVPHLPFGSPDAMFWQALADLFPQFLGFTISFFAIGAFWAGHHRALGLAAHWDDRLLMSNLVFLFAVAAMPFFTAFASENPIQRVPVSIYAGWLLLLALLNIRLQHIVLTPPMLDESAPPERVAMIRRRALAVALGAATALVVGIVLPMFGQMALMGIPAWRLALDWRVRRQAKAQAEAEAVATE
jgi:uncharacterized membrane protein